MKATKKVATEFRLAEIAEIVRSPREHTVDIDPAANAPFLRRDEINLAIENFELFPEIEDQLEGLATAFVSSGLVRIMPFVGYLAARGFGRIKY